ncbi:MAG: hypothetical protein O7D30_12430, partial [Rickettsia endosymbiont of Ixodes persulcatus]|nr:hypothetical protein [Rickettsia endosymbiont of Ixodes persulcatus]
PLNMFNQLAQIQTLLVQQHHEQLSGTIRGIKKKKFKEQSKVFIYVRSMIHRQFESIAIV